MDCPQTSQTKAINYSLQLDNKAPLLKRTHTYIHEHGKVKLVFNQKINFLIFFKDEKLASNYLKVGLSLKRVHFPSTELSTDIIVVKLDKLWTHSHVPMPVVSVSSTRWLGYHCMKREQTQHSLLPFVSYIPETQLLKQWCSYSITQESNQSILISYAWSWSRKQP